MAKIGQGPARQVRDGSELVLYSNFSDSLMRLVNAGHSMQEILHSEWPGQRRLGWPLLVFLSQLRSIHRITARQRLNSLDDTVSTNNMGIDSKVTIEHKNELQREAR